MSSAPAGTGEAVGEGKEEVEEVGGGDVMLGRGRREWYMVSVWPESDLSMIRRGDGALLCE